jgi:orotate phosphoribosyltransferase-like protein
MLVDDQIIHNEKFFEQCIELMKPKAKDYASNGVVFVELLREAWETQVSPSVVLWILLRKHISAIRNYVVLNKTESESIDSRLMDVANMMSLLYMWNKFPKNIYVDVSDYILEHEDCERPNAEESCLMIPDEEQCDRCVFLKWLVKQQNDLDSRGISSQSIQKRLDFSRGPSETLN